MPPLAISQARAGSIAAALTYGNRARSVRSLYRRSGVATRHSVLLEPAPEGGVTQSFYPLPRTDNDRGPTTSQRMQVYAEKAPELAITACRRSLQRSDQPPRAITHLITVSCTGFASPGMELALIPALGLRPDVARTHVGFMGCHGLLNGLRLASSIVRADPEAVVLVCAVELCSLHHQYTDDAQQIVANALFSDGAAAILIRRHQPGSRAWRWHDQTSRVLPQTSDLMSWRIGDHGFEMTLSPRLPEIIRCNLNPWLSLWLADHSLRISDIRSWAIHPGGPRILTAAAQGAGFDPQLLLPSQQVLADYGNMSSPTVAFILERLMQAGASPPCVVLAFGPGLTIEAALLMPPN